MSDKTPAEKLLALCAEEQEDCAPDVCHTCRLAAALKVCVEFIHESASESCEYACGCPAIHRPLSSCPPHGRCVTCKARAALSEAARLTSSEGE